METNTTQKKYKLGTFVSRLFLLLAFTFTFITIQAQSPQKMTYQSVVRDASGNLLTNTSVGIQISILRDTPTGTNVYTETYTPNPQTNINGLVSLKIGEGITSSPPFSTITWGNGPYFLRVGIDPTGGTNYTIIGTNELLSVPYAFYSETTGDLRLNKRWSLSGNSGTNSNLDFLGTTDEQPLRFQVNRINFGSLNPTIWNLYLGREAGNESIGGSHNIGLGNSSLRNSEGDNNIGIGNLSLTSLTVGSNNIGIGYRALVDNMADNNIGIGYEALEENTTGTNNVAIGNDALENGIVGSGNTAIGNNSMKSVIASSNNTAIGTDAMPNATGFNNTAIGHEAEVSNPAASHQVRIGNTQITSATIQVAWTVTSDKKWKEQIRPLSYGLDFVSQLKPVDYFRKNNEAKTREIGFIAQDVEKVLTTVGYKDQGFLSKDTKGNLSLRYNDLIPLLTKAIQELDANNEALQKLNSELVKRVEKLEQR